MAAERILVEIRRLTNELESLVPAAEEALICEGLGAAGKVVADMLIDCSCGSGHLWRGVEGSICPTCDLMISLGKGTAK